MLISFFKLCNLFFVRFVALLHLLLNLLVLLKRYFGYRLRLFDDLFIFSWTFQAILLYFWSSFRCSVLGNFYDFFILSNFLLLVFNDGLQLLYFFHFSSKPISQSFIFVLDEHIRLFEQIFHLNFDSFCLRRTCRITFLFFLGTNRSQVFLIINFDVFRLFLEKFDYRFFDLYSFTCWTHTNGIILNILMLTLYTNSHEESSNYHDSLIPSSIIPIIPLKCYGNIPHWSK